MPSNRRLQSPPGRTGSLARGSYNFRTFVSGLFGLRRSRCVVASTGVFLGCCAPLMSICGQWCLQAPLGAAELYSYRKGSCCWRCLFPTSLMIRGHFSVSVPPTCLEERRQLEPELAFWSKFASAKAAHILLLVPL